jgi:hypothetical protein
MQDKLRLLDQVREKLRVKHYSSRTEQAYLDWIKRFILFHGKVTPKPWGTARFGIYQPSGDTSEGGGIHPEPGTQRSGVPLSRGAREGAWVAR